MLSNQEYLSSQQWIVFSEQDNPDKGNPNSALSYQDSFIRWVPALNDDSTTPYGVLHFYPFDYPAILLGAKDTRLPELGNANKYLVDLGYTLVQRPHGGLAVVNDSGVLNFGLVSDNRHFDLSIDTAYEQMVALVAKSLEPFGVKVESYEVPDSYCPGKFDLVVNGQKIGGIAQRRFKSGVTTAAYISVDGNQQARAELIQAYYRTGEAGDDYPLVNPNSMITVEAVIGESITVDAYQKLLISTMEQFGSVIQGDYENPELKALYTKAFEKTAVRSDKIQPDQLP